MREQHRHRRRGDPFALLMIDIDEFGKVNNAYGHLAGNDVLRAVAEVIADVAPTYLIGRWGGDEFAVLLGAGMQTTVEIAEHIRARVQALTVLVEHPAATLTGTTVSIGGVTHVGTGGSLATLMCMADNALFDAKGNGRNRVLVRPGQ